MATTMVGSGLIGLGACGLLDWNTFENDARVPQRITSVRLDLGAGRVNLRGVPKGTEASLHRSVRYRGDKPQGASHRVENGVLVLGGCGNECSVSYTVDVPAGLPVSGGTSSGSVVLARVGSVDVTTHSGRIELDGVTGPADVHTSNGRIEARGLAGPVRARTSNGRIELTPLNPQDVRAETSNGAIVVTVPTGRYRVTASTHHGHKNIGIANDPAGEHEIDLTTANGSITVRNG
ncbi:MULTISPECIES: DUF4097 family beta strand repeat-containing protein [unclassified Streptomyces]|uniref:DUF4097 family beta strand repeat-containing protein n=1 Tax=unclassified Streptomyces TaxID=2593676 RepID=UPI003410803C